jgi:hypothetical protein
MFEYKAFYKIQIKFNNIGDNENCSIINCNNNTNKLYEIYDNFPIKILLKLCNIHKLSNNNINEVDVCSYSDCKNLAMHKGYEKI